MRINGAVDATHPDDESAATGPGFLPLLSFDLRAILRAPSSVMNTGEQQGMARFFCQPSGFCVSEFCVSEV